MTAKPSRETAASTHLTDTKTSSAQRSNRGARHALRVPSRRHLLASMEVRGAAAGEQFSASAPNTRIAVKNESKAMRREEGNSETKRKVVGLKKHGFGRRKKKRRVSSEDFPVDVSVDGASASKNIPTRLEDIPNPPPSIQALILRRKGESVVDLLAPFFPKSPHDWSKDRRSWDELYLSKMESPSGYKERRGQVLSESNEADTVQERMVSEKEIAEEHFPRTEDAQVDVSEEVGVADCSIESKERRSCVVAIDEEANMDDSGEDVPTWAERAILEITPVPVQTHKRSRQVEETAFGKKEEKRDTVECQSCSEPGAENISDEKASLANQLKKAPVCDRWLISVSRLPLGFVSKKVSRSTPVRVLWGAAYLLCVMAIAAMAHEVFSDRIIFVQAFFGLAFWFFGHLMTGAGMLLLKKSRSVENQRISS